MGTTFVQPTGMGLVDQFLGEDAFSVWPWRLLFVRCYEIKMMFYAHRLHGKAKNHNNSWKTSNQLKMFDYCLGWYKIANQLYSESGEWPFWKHCGIAKSLCVTYSFIINNFQWIFKFEVKHAYTFLAFSEHPIHCRPRRDLSSFTFKGCWNLRIASVTIGDILILPVYVKWR